MADPLNILVIEDEKRIADFIARGLEESGYTVEVAENGTTALARIHDIDFDLIILDLMMPVMDGHEFIEVYRREHSTPIILLTARVEEEEQVISLELGADDYVTKPFRPRELMARVRAVLRRAGQSEPPAKVLKAAGITLDRDSRSVQVDQRYVDLTPSEFDLLAILMASPGRVYSRIELLDALQGTTFEGIARTIDQHIRNLRAKIEPRRSNGA